MDEFLKQLAEKLQVFGADIISADETADWPTGKLDEFVEAGVLTEIQHSKGVVCSECEENCFIEPDIRTIPETGKTTGVFVCTRNPDIGRIEVDLNRLRQWRINEDKLIELGYCMEGYRVPWDNDNDLYIPLKDAVNMASDDSITVRKMSKMLEDPEFPVHRMHKGRRCRVHMPEFRKWIEYSQHGIITDANIEKYLEGVRERTEAALHKKKSKK